MMELMPAFMRTAIHQENNFLTQGKITLPQFWVLNHLYTNKITKMSDLATYLNTSRPAVTGIIDRLISAEFVLRRYDENDRRIILIEITAKGKTIVSDVRRQKFESIMKAFSNISARDRAQYLRTIERISKVMNEDAQNR